MNLNIHLHRLALLAVVVGTAGGLAASAAEDNPAGPPPEARQFDFWVGEWEVTTPDGKLSGHNRIEKLLGDRVLQENWTGTSGHVGKSFNLYDASIGKWRQFWVDASGLALVLTGGIVEGAMVLEGVRLSDGKSVLDRITWTPGADGTVRQLWETSDDGGANWTVIFDGLYRRKA